MTSIKHLFKSLFSAGLLIVVAFALLAPTISLAQEKKPEIPPPAPPPKTSSVPASQQSGAACGKTATEAQVNGIAAKLREFQAKQQAKNKKEVKAAEQATNRKP